MKILLLLIPFASFAQTGKIAKNGAVQISFETTNGKTLVEITNTNQVRSRIDYKVNDSLTSVVLDHGGRVKFTIQEKDFVIKAINWDTYPGSAEWLKADSEIRAFGIGAEKNTNVKSPKMQCGEVVRT